MFQFLMNHRNKIQKTEYICNTNSTNIQMARIKDKIKTKLSSSLAFISYLCNSSIRVICVHVFVLSVLCLLSSDLYAEEMLKTSKVKVGDKAPLTDSLKKPHEDGKAIVLLLLSNPMQCENCEKVSQLIKEEIEKYKDNVSSIAKGGEDMRGALDEETIQLKKLYGFVTVGQPWTFIIDREGILKKIFIGQISKEELNDAIKQAIEKKVGEGEKSGDIVGQGFSPAGVKEFTFVVAEGNIELNGTKFSVWTYNGTVPGPEIRVKEGDIVRVKLQNKSGAKHGMFFHGLHVSPKVAMQEEVPVEPGYEYTYEFEAKPSGTHLYHCSYNMAEHLDRGMYGAFIVEEKTTPSSPPLRPPPSPPLEGGEKGEVEGGEGGGYKEFVYIIDDWNSKAAKGESHHGAGHPRDMMDYDITTINGKSITDSPAVMDVKAGERVRIRLANIGSLPHALRLAEGFTITHMDSYPLPEPRKENSLTLLGGQRYDIVITPDKKGKLSFYHSINFPPTFEQKMAELSNSEHSHDEHNPPSPVDPVTTIVAVPRITTKGITKEEIAIVMEVK